MRKARSRNFILVICAIFLIFILGFSTVRTVVEMLLEYSKKNVEKEVLANVLPISSEVVLNGDARFIGATPNVMETGLTNFNVKLTGKEDKATYSMEFCNRNDREIFYSNLVEGNIECRDMTSKKTDCSNILVNKDVYSEGKKIRKNEGLKPNGCLRVVISFQYVGDVYETTNIFVDKYTLKFNIK